MVLNLVYTLIMLVGLLIAGIDYVTDYLVEATAVRPTLLFINRSAFTPPEESFGSGILSGEARKQAGRSPLLLALKSRLALEHPSTI